ncbi:MAG: hypothetical protein ACD_73C00503G0002 [uncultured bacterium]|nr:MAG: hypothetical protein ACD_73C00503G0002 [uncultured bacterium]
MIKFNVTVAKPETVQTGLLVIGVKKDEFEKNAIIKKLDEKLGGILSQVLKKEKFEGKAGQSKLFHSHNKLDAEYLYIAGLGDGKGFDAENIRKIAGGIYKTAQGLRINNVSFTLLAHGFKKLDTDQIAQAITEGFDLASYVFSRYKPIPKDAHEIDTVQIICEKADKSTVEKALHRGLALAKGVKLARDLINTPAQDMTPLALADAATNFTNVTTKILKIPEIKKLKMGAYLGVAQGAINPPAFIEMHYKPTGKAKKVVAIVGKGVTFDSGGLSIKPAKSMETMKDDMSGSAAVIGLMSVISELAPKVEVWGIVAAAENAVDANSQRPGDIVTAMNGKTIEVLNTDAEGRLTLADACHYAVQKKPDYIIDIATLTGACLVALGDRISAILGNDKDLIQSLISAGKKAGEALWEMPLAQEYKEELKSPIADLKNIGGSYGGTINGALFIGEFVGDTKWAHLDIAGPSWTEKPKEYESRGGTGVMVKTLAELLKKLSH